MRIQLMCVTIFQLLGHKKENFFAATGVMSKNGKDP